MTPEDGLELLEQMSPESGRTIQESGDIINLADAYYVEDGVVKLRTSSPGGGGFASDVTKDQGDDSISNGEFDNWTSIESPDDFTFVGDGPTATSSRVEKESTNVHGGSFAANLITTDIGEAFPGLGNFILLEQEVDLSITANTYGIKGWLMREAAETAYFALILQCNVGGTDYEYNFTGASAGTWVVSGGGPSADAIYSLTNTEIGTSYTEALDLTGIAGAPATATDIKVIFGSFNGNLGGGNANFFLDDMTIFDDSAPGVDLMTNGDFETWSVLSSSPDDYESQVSKLGASTDGVVEQEETNVLTGTYAAKLVSGIDGVGDQAIMLWQEFTPDTAEEYIYSLFTKQGASYSARTKLFFVEGNPSLLNTDTAQWGYGRAYNFTTQLWDDVTETVGWFTSLTYLDDGTNYNGGMFYAPGGADSAEEITADDQQLTTTTDLGTSDLIWALGTVTGGAYDGLDITILCVADNFPDSATLQSYMETELGATSIAMAAFYDSEGDGYNPIGELGADYLGYNTGTPGATTSSGSPEFYYQDGFRHGVPGSSDYEIELPETSDEFALTQGTIDAFVGITGDISMVISSPEVSNSFVYVDRVAFTELTNTDNVTVYGFTSTVDPANMTDGDKLLDFGLGGISALSVDKDGKAGSNILDSLDFSELPILQDKLLNTSGVELTERLVSVTEVDMTATGDTQLSSLSANDLFMPTRVILQTTEISGGGADGTVTVGTNSGSYDNILSSVSPNDNTNGAVTGAMDGTGIPLATSSEDIFLSVTSAATYSSQSIKAYVFGYFLANVE